MNKQKINGQEDLKNISHYKLQTPITIYIEIKFSMNTTTKNSQFIEFKNLYNSYKQP